VCVEGRACWQVVDVCLVCGYWPTGGCLFLYFLSFSFVSVMDVCVPFLRCLFTLPKGVVDGLCGLLSSSVPLDSARFAPGDASRQRVGAQGQPSHYWRLPLPRAFDDDTEVGWPDVPKVACRTVARWVCRSLQLLLMMPPRRYNGRHTQHAMMFVQFEQAGSG